MTESGDLEEINKTIEGKFGGSGCRYIQAMQQEKAWKEQLNGLPLGSADMEKMKNKIHEAAIKCGGNPEEFEKAMADLFTKEIGPLIKPL